MATTEKIVGKNRENIPNWSFKLMTFIMKIMDVFGDHSNKNFKTLGVLSGQTVVDYGCGPARYIKNISRVVGEKGKLFAVDIHPLAIKKVNQKIEKYKLLNVEACLSNGYTSPVPDKTADLVLALDMFHMIENPTELLNEFKRILKPDGLAIIEDGHQARAKTKTKILESGCFKVVEENKHHLKCISI